MKKRSLEDILGEHWQDPYDAQYQYVMSLLDAGRIRPVKSSPGNGKKPALHTQYWLVEEKPDYSAWQEELLYRTDPHISVDYYLHHMDAYGETAPMLNVSQSICRTGVFCSAPLYPGMKEALRYGVRKSFYPAVQDGRS